MVHIFAILHYLCQGDQELLTSSDVGRGTTPHQILNILAWSVNMGVGGCGENVNRTFWRPRPASALQPIRANGISGISHRFGMTPNLTDAQRWQVVAGVGSRLALETRSCFCLSKCIIIQITFMVPLTHSQQLVNETVTRGNSQSNRGKPRAHGLSGRNKNKPMASPIPDAKTMCLRCRLRPNWHANFQGRLVRIPPHTYCEFCWYRISSCRTEFEPVLDPTQPKLKVARDFYTVTNVRVPNQKLFDVHIIALQICRCSYSFDVPKQYRNICNKQVLHVLSTRQGMDIWTYMAKRQLAYRNICNKQVLHVLSTRQGMDIWTYMAKRQLAYRNICNMQVLHVLNTRQGMDIWTYMAKRQLAYRNTCNKQVLHVLSTRQGMDIWTYMAKRQLAYRNICNKQVLHVLNTRQGMDIWTYMAKRQLATPNYEGRRPRSASLNPRSRCFASGSPRTKTLQFLPIQALIAFCYTRRFLKSSCGDYRMRSLVYNNSALSDSSCTHATIDSIQQRGQNFGYAWAQILSHISWE
ncbi:hypothetical protein J6590_052840 [Homalodisca vitripennis]|nr:hypothetical protein J6590_052840 [Homalodisca vitripennis]